MLHNVNHLRWKIVALLVAPLTFVMTLDRTAMAVAAPTIQNELGLSIVEMSMILTIYFWAYAIGQIPAGRAAERFGSRKVLFGTSTLWSLMMLATPLGSSFAWLFGCRLVLAGAQSADWSSSVVALKRWVPAGERAKGNALLLAGLYLGPIISAPLTAWTIARFGWHAVFYGFGALGLLLGAIWWLGYRDTPAAHPLITKAEAEYIAAGQPPERTATRGALRRCLRQWRFWIFGIQYFLLVLIQSFYTTWLPTYLMRARGLSLKAMGLYASLPWVAVFVAVFAAGAFSDWLLRKTGSIYRARTPVAMSGFVVSALALAAASRADSMAVVIGLLCLSFAAVGFVQVVVWSATQDLGRAFAGVMSGWTNVWGALSNVAGPMTLALIVKVTHSWGSGMIVIGAAAACGALLWLFVHPERPLLGDDIDGPPAPEEARATTGPARNAGVSRNDARETDADGDADAGKVSEQNG